MYQVFIAGEVNDYPFLIIGNGAVQLESCGQIEDMGSKTNPLDSAGQYYFIRFWHLM